MLLWYLAQASCTIIPRRLSHATLLHKKSPQNVARENSKLECYRRVAVIGHRGSPYAAMENTTTSFVSAARAGAHGVELDAFLLKCGTLVVFHGTGGNKNPGSLKSYCGVDGSM